MRQGFMREGQKSHPGNNAKSIRIPERVECVSGRLDRTDGISTYILLELGLNAWIWLRNGLKIMARFEQPEPRNIFQIF